MRPSKLGGPMWMMRSKRPGRMSAGSSTSRRFVAAITITPVSPVGHAKGRIQRSGLMAIFLIPGEPQTQVRCPASCTQGLSLPCSRHCGAGI